MSTLHSLVFIAATICILFLAGCGDSKKDSANPSGGTDAAVAGQTASTDESEDSKRPRTIAPTSVPKFEAEPIDLTHNPARAEEMVSDAESASRRGDYSVAAQAYNDAMVNDPQNPDIPYKGAINYASWGKKDLAFESLALAADLGYSDIGSVTSQSEFDSMRPNPRFDKILERIEANR